MPRTSQPARSTSGMSSRSGGGRADCGNEPRATHRHTRIGAGAPSSAVRAGDVGGAAHRLRAPHDQNGGGQALRGAVSLRRRARAVHARAGDGPPTEEGGHRGARVLRCPDRSDAGAHPRGGARARGSTRRACAQPAFGGHRDGGPPARDANRHVERPLPRAVARVVSGVGSRALAWGPPDTIAKSGRGSGARHHRLRRGAAPPRRRAAHLGVSRGAAVAPRAGAGRGRDSGPRGRCCDHRDDRDAQ